MLFLGLEICVSFIFIIVVFFFLIFLCCSCSVAVVLKIASNVHTFPAFLWFILRSVLLELARMAVLAFLVFPVSVDRAGKVILEGCKGETAKVRILISKKNH